MVARRQPATGQGPRRQPSPWRRLLHLSDQLLLLPWGAYLSQPGRRSRPLLLNPVRFSRHWRVVELERCLQISSSTVRRR
jgi:hypothetical protein